MIRSGNANCANVTRNKYKFMHILFVILSKQDNGLYILSQLFFYLTLFFNSVKKAIFKI